MKKNKILDSAISLDILKADLGLIEKPTEDWNIIEPIECGHYLAAGIEYVFKNGELILESECTDKCESDCSNKKEKNKCSTCDNKSCSNIIKSLEEYRASKKLERGE